MARRRRQNAQVTIRLSEALRAELERRADARDCTISEEAREILARSLRASASKGDGGANA